MSDSKIECVWTADEILEALDSDRFYSLPHLYATDLSLYLEKCTRLMAAFEQESFNCNRHESPESLIDRLRAAIEAKDET